MKIMIEQQQMMMYSTLTMFHIRECWLMIVHEHFVPFLQQQQQQRHLHETPMQRWCQMQPSLCGVIPSVLFLYSFDSFVMSLLMHSQQSISSLVVEPEQRCCVGPVDWDSGSLSCAS